MNSIGLVGAICSTTMNRPASWSANVLTLPSVMTRNACSAPLLDQCAQDPVEPHAHQLPESVVVDLERVTSAEQQRDLAEQDEQSPYRQLQLLRIAGQRVGAERREDARMLHQQVCVCIEQRHHVRPGDRVGQPDHAGQRRARRGDPGAAGEFAGRDHSGGDAVGRNVAQHGQSAGITGGDRYPGVPEAGVAERGRPDTRGVADQRIGCQAFTPPDCGRCVVVAWDAQQRDLVGPRGAHRDKGELDVEQRVLEVVADRIQLWQRISLGGRLRWFRSRRGLRFVGAASEIRPVQWWHHRWRRRGVGGRSGNRRPAALTGIWDSDYGDLVDAEQGVHAAQLSGTAAEPGELVGMRDQAEDRVVLEVVVDEPGRVEAVEVIAARQQRRRNWGVEIQRRRWLGHRGGHRQAVVERLHGRGVLAEYQRPVLVGRCGRKRLQHVGPRRAATGDGRRMKCEIGVPVEHPGPGFGVLADHEIEAQHCYRRHRWDARRQCGQLRRLRRGWCSGVAAREGTLLVDQQLRLGGVHLVDAGEQTWMTGPQIEPQQVTRLHPQGLAWAQGQHAIGLAGALGVPGRRPQQPA